MMINTRNRLQPNRSGKGASWVATRRQLFLTRKNVSQLQTWDDRSCHLNDGSAVPRSASEKFVSLSAGVEKVVLEDSKKTMTVSKCLTATVKVAMSVNESESNHESGDDSDNDSGEGEKPCGIGKRNETGKPH